MFLLYPCCDQKRLRQGGGWSENSHWRENRQLRAEFRGSAPDAGKIPGVLGMQNVLNSVSMAVGVMEKALYSSYTVDRVIKDSLLTFNFSCIGSHSRSFRVLQITRTVQKVSAFPHVW